MKSFHVFKLVLDNASRVLRFVATASLGKALTVTLLLAGGWQLAGAQSAQLPEASVKAAFLYKFISFIEWPRPFKPDEPIKFGVMGSEAIASELRALVANRTVDSHAVSVASVQRPADLEGVQVLFVGRSAMPKMSSLLPQADKQNIVVVTEAAEALARGSAINFVIVDGHVRFEVSLRAVKRAGVKLSSRLLAVAKSVEPELP